jgi:hypothetical protein
MNGGAIPPIANMNDALVSGKNIRSKTVLVCREIIALWVRKSQQTPAII